MAKIYKNKTKNNEVFTKGEVRVEVTDDTPVKTIKTLNSLWTKRAVMVTTIANEQSALIAKDAEIVLMDIEVSKLDLKVKEE